MRNIWNLYDKLIKADGETLRDRSISRAKRDYVSTSETSLSRKIAKINNEERQFLIVSQGNNSMHTKTITSMPDEKFYDGDYIVWNNRHWLITETDSEDEIYSRGTIRECQRTIRWQNKNGEIVERWCVVEDKNTGKGINSNEKIDLINTIFYVLLPLDEETMKIHRYQRFIIDVDMEEPNTYVVSDRNVISKIYCPENQRGIIGLTLTQDERSQTKDDIENVIADYKEPKENIIGTNCEIEFSGSEPSIKAGGRYKTFKAKFFDDDDNPINSVAAKWTVTFMPEQEKYFDVVIDGDSLKIKAAYDPSIINSQIKIELSNEDDSCSCSLFAKVVYVL